MKKFLLALCFGLIMASNALAQVIINGAEMPLTDDCYTVSATTSVESVDIKSGSTLIIPNGVALTVTGTVISPDVTCLIIEEGGQLINGDDGNDGSAGINATIKKRIMKYNEVQSNDGYYAISSPIYSTFDADAYWGTGNLELDSDLIDYLCENCYDLYVYFEESNYWLSYKDDEYHDLFNSYSLGCGFLYANTDSNNNGYIEHSFYGTVNFAKKIKYDLSYDGGNESYKGFNLIGNPYPHNIYKGQGAEYAISETDMGTGYYKIINGGQFIPTTNDEEITPCQGILIKVLNEEGTTLTINKISHKPLTKENNHNTLELKVSGINGEDKAFVYFYEGYGLDKIDNLSDVYPVLCLRHDNQDYAIGCVGTQCESVDVIFRSTQAGFYTLNLGKKTGSYNYLHLIDNLTGDDIDLLKEDSYKFYSFGNEDESRFKLVTRINNNTGNNTFAYISNGNIIIAGLEGNATLQVFDAVGRLVSNEVVCGTSGVVCRANKPNTTGVYVLRLMTNDGIQTQKIIVE